MLQQFGTTNECVDNKLSLVSVPMVGPSGEGLQRYPDNTFLKHKCALLSSLQISEANAVLPRTRCSALTILMFEIWSHQQRRTERATCSALARNHQFNIDLSPPL